MSKLGLFPRIYRAMFNLATLALVLSLSVLSCTSQPSYPLKEAFKNPPDTFYGCTEKSELRIMNLNCEYQTNPLGIDISNPRLSWILEQNNQKDRGQKQTAYRLLVASSKDKLENDEGDLWDTGKMESDQNQSFSC